MKKTVIRCMEDLLEIFPRMTQSQIMILYRQSLRTIKYYNELLGKVTDRNKQDEYLDIIGKYLEYTDFLSGYLARCYCVSNGYNI